MDPKSPNKPKGFKPGSRRGQEQQRISEAVKRMRETGEAWVTRYTDGKRQRLKLTPIPETGLEGWCGEALHRGPRGFRYVRLMVKDGLRAITRSGNIFYIQEADLAALVE